MTAGNFFSKPQRLSGRKTIDALFSQGEGGFVYPVRYIYKVGEGQGAAVLVSVSKKHHKRAVARNLIKRRIREAFRTRNAELERIAAEKGIKIEIALLYATKDIVEFEKIGDAVGKIIAQICERV